MRPARVALVAITTAIIGAGIGAAVGAVVALHTVGRHSVTIVQQNLPPPDRVAKVNDIASIIGRVEPAVVAISSDQRSGSGIVIGSRGLVVTNYHVIAGANYIHVNLFHQATYRTAYVIGYDQSNDVALLQINDVANLATATLGDSSRVQVGSDVVAVGNALDLSGGPTVTSGIVSAVGRTIGDSTLANGAAVPPNLIQTDAAINPGNSGGPLVDADGDVIGINTLTIQTLGFAIPINTVKGLLPALSAGTKVATADLGIGMQDNTKQLASEYGISISTGALVSQVAVGSPAAQAGLQPYDVIDRFGGQPVADSAGLIALIAGHHDGDVVPMTVVRASLTLHLTVTLAQASAASAASAASGAGR
jgi:S1-C subfamily serine protease